MRILNTVCLAALVLAGAAGHTAAQRGQSQQIGSFVIFHDVDPITDVSHTGALSPDTDNLAFVGWQCRGDTTTMFLAWDGTPSGEEADFIYRFDQDAPASTVLAQDGQDGKLWLWFPLEETYQLTQRAMTASRFVVRWQDTEEAVHDLIFNLNSSGRALRTLPCIAQARPPVLGAPAPAVRKPDDKG